MIALLLLLVVASSDTLNRNPTRKRLIQSDHFNSSTNKLVGYDIEHFDPVRPLVLLLRDKPTVEHNPVTAKMTTGTSTHVCTFSLAT